MLIIHSLIDFLFEGFERVAKNLSSPSDSLGRSEVYDPHQRLFMFAFLWVGIKEGILVSHDIAKPKTKPQGDASHTL